MSQTSYWVNMSTDYMANISISGKYYIRKHYLLISNQKPEQNSFNLLCILPVLTYGAETWVTTKAILQKLIVTQRAMERRLVGVSLRDRMTNKWLRKESKVSDIVKRIANLKWQWAGHMARKSDSWCKDLLEWRPWEHKRPVGRPQMRWKDDIRKVAGQNWMLVAQDRARWRGLKEAYTKLVEEGLR
ncbi:hypothetical protein ABMA28_002113 [Loxostege sticticalis]|uniref:Endonuclease-reverse transcriptase n=1 Tax=Loxostege sticticalis TaxID=481309 RepID=A0ABD0T413_LOXSC